MGDMANAVGSLLAVFDTELVKNANWTIHDAAAGANAKVYKCTGDITYYVWIGDNQTNYSNIRAWAAWDAGTHTGSGSQTANAILTKSKSTYNIFINGNRFVYINLDSSYCYGHYCGLIKRIDPTKNLVLIYAGASGTYYDTYNWLGGWDDGSYARLRLMEDVDGTPSVTAHPFGGPVGETTHYFQDLDDRVRIRETSIWYGTSPRYLVGWMDGVFSLFFTLPGFPEGAQDIITVDGMDWVAYYRTINKERFLVRLD